MKRRTFGLLAGSSIMAGSAGLAEAQSSPASSLGAGLTPFGSEVAGNADGSIPAWTGGLTTLPSGVTPGKYVPELFPDEQPVAVIDSSNMADHAAMLTPGVMAMMTKYGFSIKVYPTHRTAAAPQSIYDNIAKNKDSAKFVSQDPIGGRFGFEGAYGGVAFPVLDTSNPLTAGGQAMWNSQTAWGGFCYTYKNYSWSVSDGQPSMAYAAITNFKYPYFDPNGSLATFNGMLNNQYFATYAPQNIQGQILLLYHFTNPYLHPNEAWELLNGQGRVRRAPEVTFDTPATQTNGIAQYDEVFGFSGSLERYDWKSLGKREMYIPYNNNGLFGAPATVAHQAHFIDPELVRWEKHRVWVVEATLHPGERNVLARRTIYLDEDTWFFSLSDAYDANNDLYKVGMMFNNCRPDLPGVVFGNNVVYNLQTDDYATCTGPWDEVKNQTGLTFQTDFPDSLFDPSNMAASAQY